jgi:hypothetical protein
MKEGLVIYKELFSCRIFGISKLFHKQKSFWHRFKADSFWRNSNDSYGEVFRCDQNVLFWFFDEKYEVTFGWSQEGWNFNLRVNENRVSTKMWRTRSDIWLVTKRFKFQFQGYWEPCFKAFILFAWIMILFRMRKHCLPIQIACLWLERAWLGT